MLIDSPRITTRDRKVWEQRHRYDLPLSRGARIERLEAQALRAVEEWRGGGDGIVSVSWGKDSVVAAHIALKVDPDLRLVWVRSDPFETPEAEVVRDYFLAAHPGARYEERVAVLRNPKRGEPGFAKHRLDPDAKHQDVLGEHIPERWVSGLRGQESRMRALSIAWSGMATRNTCRPLAFWRGPDIFAYCAREGLPLHPAYAMSFGGVLDRQWIRTHPLCSIVEMKTDVAQWEDRYYGDVIRGALAQRAEWRAQGDPRGGVNVPGGGV